MSNEEKLAFNLALMKASRLVNSYDGVIPNEFDRRNICLAIFKLKKSVKQQPIKKKK